MSPECPADWAGRGCGIRAAAVQDLSQICYGPRPWRGGRLARADLPNLKLGESPVRGLVQVGEGQSVGLVGPQPLHAAEHPVVVSGLLRLRHIGGGPGAVPPTPVSELPPAHRGVGLEGEG